MGLYVLSFFVIWHFYAIWITRLKFKSGLDEIDRVPTSRLTGLYAYYAIIYSIHPPHIAPLLRRSFDNSLLFFLQIAVKARFVTAQARQLVPVASHENCTGWSKAIVVVSLINRRLGSTVDSWMLKVGTGGTTCGWSLDVACRAITNVTWGINQVTEWASE